MKEINFEYYKKNNNLKEELVLINNELSLSTSFTKLNDVYLYSYLWSIITKDFFIFKDFERVYSDLTYLDHILNRKDELRSKLDLTKIIKGNYFLLGGENNYWHLLIDYLPRLICLKKINLKEIIVLIDSEISNKFQIFIRDILEKLNLEKIKFIKINRINKLYKFENLFISKRPRIEFTYSFYNELFGKYLKKNSSKNLYIKRGNVKNRKVINEGEVEKLLLKYDYDIIDCSQLNVQDQINIFSQAKNVIIVSGASLANLLFVPNNINVVEIRSNLDGNFSSEIQMNNRFNLYKFIKSQKIGEKLRKDIIVDIPELDNLIKSKKIY